MSLVGNEQTKLTAAYLNGLAIAVTAIGGLAPLFSRVYAGPGAASLPLVAMLAVSAICLTVSALLHLSARHLLRRLLE